MLRVETTLAMLKVGDVFKQPSSDVPETLMRLPEPAADGWAFETDRTTWTCCSPDLRVELLASSATDVAGRVADALERFDPAVRLEVFRFFCPTCGERACGEHR